MLPRIVWCAFLSLALALAAGKDLPTIYRDDYGVPHIYARTDAGVVFGLMYAQAEDNFWQLEQDYIRALGRAAEIHGPAGLQNDILIHAFQIPKLAQEEYQKLSPDARAICDAFAAGLNHYLATHPAVKPALITRFEPWHVLAMQRSAGGVVGREGVTLAELRKAFPQLEENAAPEPAPNEDEGSNMWAISPSKSATGKAMLLINPHVAFFGAGQRYEAHLDSRQGLKVSGFAILGTPYIRSGFTEHHGWSHTNNNADMVDNWLVDQNDPRITEWTHNGVRYRSTPHGPVLGIRDGKYVAVRSARVERGGVLEQRLAMARARNLSEFKAALTRLALTGSNTLYAGRDGNIFYVHGNAIPKRAAGQWEGYHSFDELPQYTNPPSGYLQNCNSTPFLAAGAGSGLDASRYPEYMVPEMDNLRAERSRQILEHTAKFTFENWAKAALDTYVLRAEKELPALLLEWEKLKSADPARAKRLAEVMNELTSWNRTSTVASVATTLYMRWSAAKTTRSPIDALQHVKEQMEKEFGTWRIPWGQLNMLQRIHSSGTLETFDEARLSVPVAGGPGAAGFLFVFNTRTPPGGKRGYGISGNTYVAVVEFAKKVWAGSLLVFGQSADPASPHYFDQRDLYSNKAFKIAWFYERDVKLNAQRPYRPGESAEKEQ
jgi:acyl-homoserine-lactone acylase